jgi:hypothetical protein
MALSMADRHHSKYSGRIDGNTLRKKRRRKRQKCKFKNAAQDRLIRLLTTDIATLVLEYISPYVKGDKVWSYFHDPAFGCAPELRKAKINGFDPNHGLYLLSWLDFGNVERTADYIFPCIKDEQDLFIGDLVWAEHEFCSDRMFEARIKAIKEDSYVIEPQDHTNRTNNSPILRSRMQLRKLEPPPRLDTGDICWAERSCPMRTYSQIFRAEVLSFSRKKQLYTVKWLDSFGSEFLPSVVTQYQLMPYISAVPNSAYEVGDKAFGLSYNGSATKGTILFAENGMYHLKFDDTTAEYRTLDLLRDWQDGN